MPKSVPWGENVTVVLIAAGSGSTGPVSTTAFEGALKDAVRFIAQNGGTGFHYRIGLPDRHTPPFEYQGAALEALIRELRAPINRWSPART